MTCALPKVFQKQTESIYFMSKMLDNIIVVDIEATCWRGKPPPGQETEIIEIGICLLDVKTGRRVEKESILVYPEKSTVSEFCTELTSLEQWQVDRGVTFRKACKILQKKFRSKQRVWASYGNFDIRQFRHQCDTRNVPYPFSTAHLNVKTLFALKYKLDKEIGMLRALSHLKVEIEGTHHRGIDDAWNTAFILSKLL